jgi:hypothetical protein
MSRPKRIRPAEEGFRQQWVWDDEGPLTVTADLDEEGQWFVGIPVAESVRDEAAEDELFSAVTEALGAVRGVRSANQEDREVWFVTGRPRGKALMAAARSAVRDRLHLVPTP